MRRIINIIFEHPRPFGFGAVQVNIFSMDRSHKLYIAFGARYRNIQGKGTGKRPIRA